MKKSSLVKTTQTFNFTLRDVRSIQSIYRSRGFMLLWQYTNLTTLFAIDNVANRKKVNEKREFIYLRYGVTGMLSPLQRAVFRTQMSKFPGLKNVARKFSLFSTAISKSLRLFSALHSLRSILKGNSYQRSISIPITSFYQQQVVAQSQRKLFLPHINSIFLTEESLLEYTPTLIFFPTFAGICSPRRYFNFMAYSDKAHSFANSQVRLALISIIFYLIIYFSTNKSIN